MAVSTGSRVAHYGEPSNEWGSQLDSQFSDTVDLTNFANIRGLYVGTGGNLKLADHDGNAEVFHNVPTGVILPVRPRRIYATGTTAANILGLM